LLIAELVNRRGVRDEVGGVKLGRRKLKVLGYADDLVISGRGGGYKMVNKKIERLYG